MRLFDEKENRVTVSTELKLVPAFKEVLLKEKDPLLVFSYIYFMYDYRSPYQNYSAEEREGRLVNELKLGSKWKVTPVIQNAIDKYLELLETPTIRTLKSIKEGLIASSNAINLMTHMINKAVTDNGETEEGEEPEDIVKLVTNLLSIADKLPKVVDSISGLEEKIKKEQSNDSKLRGGGIKGSFED